MKNHGFGDELLANQNAILGRCWTCMDMSYINIYAHACFYIILQSRLISTRRGFTISEKCITNEDPNVNPDFSLTFLEGMKDAVHATKKKVGPNKLSHRLHRIYFIFRSKSRL